MQATKLMLRIKGAELDKKFTSRGNGPSGFDSHSIKDSKTVFGTVGTGDIGDGANCFLHKPKKKLE